MEKGMGRKFAREWYNTNRAILIAEHQRRMDAQRTPLDHYMEQFFQCADPSVVASESEKRSLQDQLLRMEFPFSLDETKAAEKQGKPAEKPTTAKARQAAAVAPVKVAAVAPKKAVVPKKTATVAPVKAAKAAVPVKDATIAPVEVAAVAPAPPKTAETTHPDELSELDIAMGFFHDLGTCKYATPVM